LTLRLKPRQAQPISGSFVLDEWEDKIYDEDDLIPANRTRFTAVRPSAGSSAAFASPEVLGLTSQLGLGLGAMSGVSSGLSPSIPAPVPADATEAPRPKRPEEPHIASHEKLVAIKEARYKGISTRQKEGDNGLRPNPPRNASSDFPTLVIEAGNAESQAALRMDKDWWFDNSPPHQPRGDVRIVLLIKVYPRTKRIIVEQWYRGQQSPSQVVTVSPRPDKPFSLYDSRHWIVEGAPMVIPFGEVFLRSKQRRETDLVFTKVFFAEFACQCWE